MGIRGAQCLLIVYDVSNRESFDEVRLWMHEFLRVTCHSFQDSLSPVIIVGNKVDLREDPNREAPLDSFVSRDEGEQLSLQLNQEIALIAASNVRDKRFDEVIAVEGEFPPNHRFLFLEVSTKTGLNITELERLATFLALRHMGQLDERALKHCIDLEWPHVSKGPDGTMRLTPKTWKRMCRPQQEITLHFAPRRRGRRNLLDSKLSTFLRLHILSFLPVFEREETWYDDEKWRKCRMPWSGRTRKLAAAEDEAVSALESTPPARDEFLDKERQCMEAAANRSQMEKEKNNCVIC